MAVDLKDKCLTDARRCTEPPRPDAKALGIPQAKACLSVLEECATADLGPLWAPTPASVASFATCSFLSAFHDLADASPGLQKGKWQNADAIETYCISQLRDRLYQLN